MGRTRRKEEGNKREEEVIREVLFGRWRKMEDVYDGGTAMERWMLDKGGIVKP